MVVEPRAGISRACCSEAHEISSEVPQLELLQSAQPDTPARPMPGTALLLCRYHRSFSWQAFGPYCHCCQLGRR